jgi:hypothetical protein
MSKIGQSCSAKLPPLIVNDMARGVYLIGSKLAQRVRAVQIVDCTGNSTTIRLKDYISQKIEPEYKTPAMAARCGGVVIQE